ncbi:hypothetical protein OG905_09285 [Streptomyces sp. NBC_00322]|uniref:hypothetical protein n=1 Tax=Streptomyces sp. NBC_00322 TaxID=2975712 RepID=UPI002E2C2EC5|nr:hypothetical protein [Streptomyces sp. NBC_00322]
MTVVTGHAAVRRRPAPGTGLDAALVGYLPTPGDLAALTGLPEHALSRDQVRTLLFPDGRAQLLEETATPLGTSGFICMPLFADELTSGADLAARSARAVERAAPLGARTVSLAGMIPSLTATATTSCGSCAGLRSSPSPRATR